MRTHTHTPTCAHSQKQVHLKYALTASWIHTHMHARKHKGKAPLASLVARALLSSFQRNRYAPSNVRDREITEEGEEEEEEEGITAFQRWP